MVGWVLAVAGFRSSDAAQLALLTAGTNPTLIRKIGEPMTSGWLIVGNLRKELTTASGDAEMAIPVSGPKGDGTLYFKAVRTAGAWRLTELEFGADEDSGRLELLEQ